MAEQALSTTKGVVLLITLVVENSNVEEFLKRSRKLYDRATAEPECLSLQFCSRKSKEKPNLTIFQLTEVWNASPEWMDEVQAKRDYFLEYYPPMEELFAESRVTEIAEHMPLWAYPLKSE